MSPIFSQVSGSLSCQLASEDDPLQKPGTVGRPVFHAEVTILAEKGKPAKPGQTGHAFVITEPGKSVTSEQVIDICSKRLANVAFRGSKGFH